MRRFLLLSLIVPSPLFAQSAEEKKAAIRFLAALQQPDGGFVPGPSDPAASAAVKSSLRATSGAVRAIKYLGGEVPNKDKALVFVKSCYQAGTGAFTETPGGKADTGTTAIGLMAVAELDPAFPTAMSVKYLADNSKTFEERRLAVAGMEAARQFAPQVKEWLAEIEKTRNPDGTYGKGNGLVRDTGSVVAMILRSGNSLSEDYRKAVIAALQAGQRPDGGFGKADAKGSDAETTYRVMRAFHLLNEKPKDVAKLTDFLARHRNPDGGYGAAPGQPSTVSGTYYAAIISHWLGQ
ncbi:MAG: terpene cyclase/mutase family protein [Zavarzinella sp.]|nr:terpene cyclase/mutase family protein [Zavarzinella sp.]